MVCSRPLSYGLCFCKISNRAWLRYFVGADSFYPCNTFRSACFFHFSSQTFQSDTQVVSTCVILEKRKQRVKQGRIPNKISGRTGNLQHFYYYLFCIMLASCTIAFLRNVLGFYQQICMRHASRLLISLTKKQKTPVQFIPDRSFLFFTKNRTIIYRLSNICKPFIYANSLLINKIICQTGVFYWFLFWLSYTLTKFKSDKRNSRWKKFF